MDRFDHLIKEKLQVECEELVLSDQRKTSLQQDMCRELGEPRQGLWRRIVGRITLFWHTTHEVSLAPVAVACILIVVAGAGVLRGITKMESPEPAPTVYFVSHTDGGTVIVPLSEDMEEQ